MLAPVRLHALLAVCDDRAAVRRCLREEDTENLQDFVTGSASFLADHRPEVLTLMIGALVKGCATGNSDEALRKAAAIAIEGIGTKHPVENTEVAGLYMD